MMKSIPFRAWGISCGLLIAVAAADPAWAQTAGKTDPGKPAAASPAPQDLEPGVNTSATSASSDASGAGNPAVPGASAVNVSGAAKSSGQRNPQKASPSKKTAPAGAGGGMNEAASAEPVDAATSGSSTSKPGAPASGAPKPGAAAPGKAHDRIELDTTQITGNRELPKVLYIVPWKRSDLGDLVGKPVNSLLDEVLAPVDRDVFKRQNRYYDALKPDEATNASGTAAAGTEEKH